MTALSVAASMGATPDVHRVVVVTVTVQGEADHKVLAEMVVRTTRIPISHRPLGRRVNRKVTPSAEEMVTPRMVAGAEVGGMEEGVVRMEVAVVDPVITRAIWGPLCVILRRRAAAAPSSSRTLPFLPHQTNQRTSQPLRHISIKWAPLPPAPLRLVPLPPAPRRLVPLPPAPPPLPPVGPCAVKAHRSRTDTHAAAQTSLWVMPAVLGPSARTRPAISAEALVGWLPASLSLFWCVAETVTGPTEDLKRQATRQ